MSLFGRIVRTVVNVATLPMAVVKDGVMVLADGEDGEGAPRTKAKLQQIKDEAEDPDEQR